MSQFRKNSYFDEEEEKEKYPRKPNYFEQQEAMRAFNERKASPSIDLQQIYQELTDIYYQVELKLGRNDPLAMRIADVRDDVYAWIK